MNYKKLHAFFGGTFDPIHFGHLKPIEIIANNIGIKKIMLLPNKEPLYRSKLVASPSQRIKMINYAILNKPLFNIDMRELNGNQPSRTVITLENIRSEINSNQPLIFIIGEDSLLNINTWYRWQDILSLCHLVVYKRFSYQIKMHTIYMQNWLNKNITSNIHKIHHSPSGYIFIANTCLYKISSTQIKKFYSQGISCKNLLPSSIIEYIKLKGLYS